MWLGKRSIIFYIGLEKNEIPLNCKNKKNNLPIITLCKIVNENISIKIYEYFQMTPQNSIKWRQDIEMTA